MNKFYQKMMKMSSKQNILFRADSSSSIGIGHIMRDLVLAKQLEGNNIIFACMELEGNIISQIPYKVITLKSNHIDEVDTIIKKYQIDMIVIDHYAINEAYEKQLKTQNPKLKILSFDDTYEKHHCDILLNHNICAKEEKYIDLVPKECEIRCGKKYTLIRDEFKKVKKLPTTNYQLPTIFIAMGGADHSNITLKILKTLQVFKSNIKIIVATTSANKNLKTLQKFCYVNKQWINLYIDYPNIAILIKKSIFAIITPSVIAHEVMYLNKPFLAIKTAKNQDEMYEYLKNHRFYVLNKINLRKIRMIVDKNR